MGLFDKILGGNDESEQSDTTSGSEPELSISDDSLSRETGFVHGEFRGERITFRSETSSNGEWTCLYAQSGDTDELPIVLLDQDHNVYRTLLAEQPLDVAVSNSGDIVATETSSDNGQQGGKVTVIDSNGDTIVSQEFDANVDNCAISNDGSYASTATFNPDNTVYIFETGTGETTEFETDLNAPRQEFSTEDGSLVLYIFDNDQRYIGVSIDGEVVWRSEEAEEDGRVAELLEASEAADPSETVEYLQEAYDIVEDENKQNQIARDLADAHWNRANEIRKQEGDTDEWWSHLNQAKEYYFNVISWRDGQKGIAKVQRKQAKYHLKQDNEEEALELLENIKDIGDKHNADLLTDADKEKIDRLK